MIEGLKPYAEYKESGLPWLRVIPSHWQTARNGNLFQQRNDTQHPDLPLLEVSLRTGVRVRDFGASKRKQVMADAAKYKRAAAGDVAYNMMRMWQGAVGVAPVDGLVSPAYVVARPFEGTEARYYTALFRNGLYMGEIDAASRGIVKDRNRLYWGQFKQMRSLLPPPDEQSAIVRFLDHANRKIDGFIRAKRKLIGLLNEQKQVITHRAVTRGLNPGVPLKPSGIPWLSDIPQHWELIPARHLFRAVTRRDVRRDDPKLSVTQRHGIIPTDDMKENSTQARTFDRFQVCHPDDLVLNKYKAHLGVFWNATQRGLITPNYTVFRPVRELSTKYFEILFHLSAYRTAFRMMIYGVTEGMSPLYTQDFYRVPVLFPSPAEQREIIKEVGRMTTREDAAINRTEREIALMQEYRTRLTADIVTGKLDVREAARHLPAEPANCLDTTDLSDDLDLEPSANEDDA